MYKFSRVYLYSGGYGKVLEFKFLVQIFRAENWKHTCQLSSNKNMPQKAAFPAFLSHENLNWSRKSFS